MDNNYKIRARAPFLSDIINLHVIGYEINGEETRTVTGTSLSYGYIEEGQITPSFMDITKNQAQVLMDDLWDCGIRPTEGAGSAGAMTATQKHLDDMRKLTFHLMEIK